MFDLATGDGLLAVNDPADLPPWDSGAPLLTLVRFALEARHLRLVHAATLGLGGRGLLIIGDGGTGKSGTTLAGLNSELQTAGDDYVAVGFENGLPVARMLYRILKQDGAGLARHAGHRIATLAAAAPNWQGKIEVDPQLYFPDCFAERLELCAVVAPRIAPDQVDPDIVPITAGDALRTLMRSNLFQFGEQEDGLTFFSRLLKLPCYRAKLGPNPTRNGSTLRRFIEGLPS